MGYDLRPNKLAKKMYVKASFQDECQLCLAALQGYCAYIGTPEIPEFGMKEFMVPYEWFQANENTGCLHTDRKDNQMHKLLKSAYEKTN